MLFPEDFREEQKSRNNPGVIYKYSFLNQDRLFLRHKLVGFGFR